jgi:nicotinate-nucleotide pyrophosphorylase (carboxylating)
MNNKSVAKIIENALKEDLGNGDHTSLACIPKNATGKAQLLIKENGIIAGIEIAKKVFLNLDKNIKMQIFFSDGSKVKKGDIAFIVEGNIISILSAERTVLNFMQRMSGIATNTYKIVSLLKGLNTRVLDTRKTTPNIRLLEKQAVKTGGGENHRMGLYDMIMIKDNHIDFAGGIEQAIKFVHNYLKKYNKNLKIEIETKNIAQIKKVLSVGGINRIMFDNFSVKDTRKAVKLVNRKYETESSGGITIKNIRKYAECGIDFISVGNLTHHIKSMDMSLKAIV